MSVLATLGALAPLIGGAIGAVGSIGSSVVGANAQSSATNSANQANKEIAQMNIDYQNAYNEHVWQREDTQLSRLKQQAVENGFSPLSALGLSTSSTVNSTSAPRSSQVVQAPNLTGFFANPLESVADFLYQKNQLDYERNALDVTKQLEDNKLKEIQRNNLEQSRIFEKSVDNAKSQNDLDNSVKKYVAELNSNTQKAINAVDDKFRRDQLNQQWQVEFNRLQNEINEFSKEFEELQKMNKSERSKRINDTINNYLNSASKILMTVDSFLSPF